MNLKNDHESYNKTSGRHGVESLDSVVGDNFAYADVDHGGAVEESARVGQVEERNRRDKSRRSYLSEKAHDCLPLPDELRFRGTSDAFFSFSHEQVYDVFFIDIFLMIH